MGEVLLPFASMWILDVIYVFRKNFVDLKISSAAPSAL